MGADGFERIKPFPDIFVAAAQQVGVEPAACVVVEDAEAGVAAARAAGAQWCLQGDGALYWVFGWMHGVGVEPAACVVVEDAMAMVVVAQAAREGRFESWM